MNPENAAVSSKGQLVIPAEIRRRFGIEAGTLVKFVVESGRLILEPETVGTKALKIHGLRGLTSRRRPGTEELLKGRRLEHERELEEETGEGEQ